MGALGKLFSRGLLIGNAATTVWTEYRKPVPKVKRLMATSKLFGTRPKKQQPKSTSYILGA